MAKKFQRVFRNRPLTTEEIAKDKETRRKVRKEFPPTKSAAASSPDSLSETLRQAIRDSDKSVYQIAKDAGVSQIVISRFLNGERDIRMATADKLADVLSVRLSVG